ncbi:hypothetical protein BGL57_01605 [Helicobacter pylori]|nr:hypothetical protein BGL57_01605 [Helicobacter pylori]
MFIVFQHDIQKARCVVALTFHKELGGREYKGLFLSG